ncbi:amino acid permease [Mycoavidus cysteinexigens]|nr:amino acid permease [Mycoavidus cysteinexigens]
MTKPLSGQAATSAARGTLDTGLKERHVAMLSIGGVIGAGLFVGSGHAIAAAGPAVIIAYLISGALVLLVMRMLGEMAVALPDTGSFSTYADHAIGRWAGFTIGWLYWWRKVLVIPLEATAAAIILHSWFPDVATWIFALAITAILTLSNLLKVAYYGELEFWFALIKVTAIISFIGIGLGAILGFFPASSVSGIDALTSVVGGFAPNGFEAVLGAMVIAMFSLFGAEVSTIAAVESKNPVRQITRATNSVIWRISIFYLASLFVVIALVPWDDPLLPEIGAYQRVLELINIPYAKALVDVIVFIALISCLNSALYTASRMIFSLSQRGDAPAAIQRTTRSGVPALAVLASTAVAFLTVIANYLMPKQVFTFLLATSGAIGLLVYLVIAISQLRLRARLLASGKELKLKMWLFPWLTWIVIVAITIILIAMFIQPNHRMEMIITAALAVVVALTGLVINRNHEAPKLPQD